METLRQAIRQACRREESHCVDALVAEYSTCPVDHVAVSAEAASLITTVREQRRHASGVDHLMHEFPLSTDEGIALMCLAEALLRIPDSATADRLIRDKLGHGNWARHLGDSPSLFVNATSWGLMVTGKLVTEHDTGTLSGALSTALARGGEPLIRHGLDLAMRLLGQQFVMGQTISEALARAKAQRQHGYRHSFDMLGEAALTHADAERYHAAYTTAIHAIGHSAACQGVIAGSGISIKLSALHPRYVRSQRERVMHELHGRLRTLMQLARQYDIGLNIDAEEAHRLEMSLDLFESLAGDPDLAGWQGMGFVVQAYQKRAPFVIDYLTALARRCQRRFMLRLVKGAYWDSEIKRTQIDGLTDYPVYTRKCHTDLAYLVCARRLLAAGDAFYPQFATHNAQTVASVTAMAAASGCSDFEFQCLHGMGEPLYNALATLGNGYRPPCRVYAPVGSHKTLLPYLVRRLLENGANSSFVNRLVDDSVSVEALSEDPLTTLHRSGHDHHPAIPLPPALYGTTRRNAAGTDLSDENTLVQIAAHLASRAETQHGAEPVIPNASPSNNLPQPVRNPANRQQVIGTVTAADEAGVATALANAAAASPRWHATAAPERAACLLRAADLFEARRNDFLSLCVREAGKTLPAAVAEIRESIDFCRYYASRIVATSHREAASPPGPAVCISPWNFPLAIFTGQIVAALAAGRPVIAKPAEQTPLIASLAVRLLHEAGIPEDVLQFVPGKGARLGPLLTTSEVINAVVFTGSTTVAQSIHRQLATREDVCLIAETGGQNAMIVDSSALTEQVVEDALLSGFDSAGQRCSALRLLCLQHEIASDTLATLRAAMREWIVGDPAQLATDIGPLIDDTARTRVQAHINAMRQRGYAIYQPSLPAACESGCFLPPTLIEIDTPEAIPHEVFGPVIHVLRFGRSELPALIDRINASGYGLTMGLHTRISQTIALVSTRAHVGNLYVNRNMIGAVVGVQPFGGEGLSGTGPKAGGPLYVPRLAGATQCSPDDLPAPAAGPSPALEQLGRWASEQGRTPLADRCRRYGALTIFGVEYPLPGPTGERNTLRFVPRGRLLCRATSTARLLDQLAAVFATGNAAELPDNAENRQICRELPAELQAQLSWQHTGEAGTADGALLDAADPAWQQHFASHEGPLRPVILPTADGEYPLYRLVIERTATINTAAAGGNAALMSLET